MRDSSTHPRPAPAAAQAHEKVLYSFRNGSDGGGPNGSLLMDKSGALYGTAWMGGAYGYGAVFKLTPSGAGYKESVIYSPSSFANANPNGGLTADKNGALYGAGWNGDVFKLTPSGSHYKYTQIFHMPQGVEGGTPQGGLVVDSSGAIYGAGYYGGRHATNCPIYGCGIIFKLTPSAHGYKDTLFSFGGGVLGHTPTSPVILDQNGNIYGTTGRGGLDPALCAAALHGCGVAFKLTPSASGFKESAIYYFGPKGKAATPTGGFLADNTGALYGATAFGGNVSEHCDGPSQPRGCGTVYKLTPTGSGYDESVLYRFRGGTDGVDPNSQLTADTGGSIYGVTNSGGSANEGTAFKLTPTGSVYTETVLHAFHGGTDGTGPSGQLLIDSAGALYGETGTGGSGGYGTVFKITQ
jgi:uncharacterized repeat protein (TIGR03803 family)